MSECQRLGLTLKDPLDALPHFPNEESWYYHVRFPAHFFLADDQCANRFQLVELERLSFRLTPGWSASSSFRENESLPVPSTNIFFRQRP